MVWEIIKKHLENGVEFPLTDGIIIGKDVKIGQDTKILPNTVILGKTVIGTGCVIGANSHIEDCTIGDNVILNNVQAFSSVVDDGAKVGPFVHLRPNTHLHKNVKIGDFVEVKHSKVGVKKSARHLVIQATVMWAEAWNFRLWSVTGQKLRRQ